MRRYARIIALCLIIAAIVSCTFKTYLAINLTNVRSKTETPLTAGCSNNKFETDSCSCGQNGKWVHGNDTNVANGGGGSTSPEYTRWNWHDLAANCHMEKLTLEGFCKLMGDDGLQIKRIYFLGDSLTFSMFDSMWRLFGNKEAPSPKGVRRHFIRTIKCDIIGIHEKLRPPFTIDIEYTRNDHLSNVVNGTDPDCGDPCVPWVDDYIANPAKTLLITNMGAHIAQPDLYKYKLGHFVETIQALSRPTDMVMFRTSVPGHENCTDHNAPLNSPLDFHTPTLYNWKYFDEYNRYTKQKWFNLTKQEEDYDTRWLILDVYPMTILRPDGHRFPDMNVDCLHYLIPGPVEWWNHLLYRNLLDLRASLLL